MKREIAIVGATSHIAKNLIDGFSNDPDNNLHMFVRPESVMAMRDFLLQIGKDDIQGKIYCGCSEFPSGQFDVIINCIGGGTPSKMNGEYSKWFLLTEHFDNMCIDYLRFSNPNAIYINFSSGAIYRLNNLNVDKIEVADYYAIAKLNMEAKHRSLSDLNIVDIRIFSFFSKFIDLNAGYFITDAIRALKRKELFKTSKQDMIRDYIHPDDLFSLVMVCIEVGTVNESIDAASQLATTKCQILQFMTNKYGLKVEEEDNEHLTCNNTSMAYCPDYTKSPKCFKFLSIHRSAGAIVDGMRGIMG